MLSLSQFPSRPSCTLCALHEHASRGRAGIPTVHHPQSLPPAPETPVVVFVGQNPGFHEDREGVPFVGPSGRIVRLAFSAGARLLPLASIYLTNTARCYTPADSPPKSRHYSTCAPFLLEDLGEIAMLHGDTKLAIVALGAPAAFHLWKLAGAKKGVKLSEAFRRNGRPIPIPGAWHFFSTFHPAAIIRNHNLIHAAQDHLRLVHDFLTGTLATPSKPTFIPPRLPTQ